MAPTPRELPASPLTPLFSMPLTPGSFLTQGFWACCPSSSSSCQAEGRVETTQECLRSHCSFCLQFVDIGIVTSIEVNHKQVDVAKKGQEVCVKIEPIPGESPKMYGRHFEATDILVSKVSHSLSS